MGRVQIVKSQGLPLFSSVANALIIPEKVIKQVNDMVYKFIWNGPDKLCRETMAKPISEGGLGFPKPEDYFRAANLKWFRLFHLSKHPWTDFLRKDADAVGGLRSLQGNRRVWRKGQADPFNLELFRNWCKWGKLFTGDSDSTMAMGIWANPLIRDRRGKPLVPGRLAKNGFQTISDFVWDPGGVVTPTEAVNAGAPRAAWLEWAAARCSIQQFTGDLLQAKGSFPGGGPESRDAISMVVAGASLDVADMKMGNILRFTAANREHKNSSFQVKVRERLGVSQDTYIAAFSKIKLTSIDTKTRSFHYRLLSGLLYGNVDFHKFGFRDSPGCNWCITGAQEQTLWHLLLECPLTQSFRDDLAGLSPSLNIPSHAWILGNDNPAVTFIAIFSAQYLYQCNYHYERPELATLSNKLRAVRNMETRIALRKNRTAKNTEKWRHINEIYPL